MLAAYVAPSAALLGTLGATANPKIKDLQQALVQYAQATGFAAANPGTVDGVLTLQTRSAVIATVPRVPKMPSAVKTVAQYAGPFLSLHPDLVTEVDKIITEYAPQIAAAIRLLAMIPSGSSSGAGTTATQTSTAARAVTAPKWYKTGTGMAAIGAGALAVTASALLLATR